MSQDALEREIVKVEFECLTHTLWQDLSDRITVFLDQITLAEL